MVQVQILSDLHLEIPSAYEDYEIPIKAPYLALLGDIGNVCDNGLFAFIREQLYNFKIIFFLLGNHESYGLTWAQETGD
ncbi:hypothetical protein LOZ39_004281, partial [Ophidiomyces ophidiicola]